MNRILTVAATTLALTLATLAPAAATASIHIASPAPAFFSNAGTVRFALRNDSSAPINLKAGDTPMTLAPGKTLKVDLPLGTRVTLADPLGARPAGDLVAQVSGNLKNTTIVLR